MFCFLKTNPAIQNTEITKLWLLLTGWQVCKDSSNDNVCWAAASDTKLNSLCFWRFLLSKPQKHHHKTTRLRGNARECKPKNKKQNMSPVSVSPPFTDIRVFFASGELRVFHLKSGEETFPHYNITLTLCCMMSRTVKRADSPVKTPIPILPMKNTASGWSLLGNILMCFWLEHTKTRPQSTQSLGSEATLLACKQGVICESVCVLLYCIWSYGTWKTSITSPELQKNDICQSAVVISNVLLINRDC